MSQMTTTICEDVPLVVNFYYQPFEEATQTYPGCGASITLESVYVEGRDHDILDGLVVEEVVADVLLQ